MDLYEIIRDRFNYNDETGWLTWKNCYFKSMDGKRAGSLRKDGYREISINNKTYKEHRIIWLWFYGYLPENQIDHRNRRKDCNWISNLREATPSCNNKNKGIQCNNKTGIIGVSETKDGRFRVYIKDNNYKSIDLGTFNTLLDGAKARYLGEVEYNYENCNSTSTAYQYIKDNDPEWLNSEMKVNKSNPNKTSGIKGICFDKINDKWMVYIQINKKRKHLGRFIELDNAVKVRYEAEILYNQTKDSQSYSYLIERKLL